MSRVETDTYINDRYAAIEDRLSVHFLPAQYQCLVCGFAWIDVLSCVCCFQVVRKRLNRPLSFAEKVRSPFHLDS